MTKEQFIKYLQGHCTEQEFIQILDWIRDGSNTSRDKGMVEELWKEFEPDGGPVEKMKYHRILDKIHQQIELKESVREAAPKAPMRSRMLTILTRVAAILLLPVLSLLLYTVYTDQERYAENSMELEVEAPAGSRMNFVLGDGTKVWLNHGSKLKFPYRFSGNERKVFLTGEAYFEVARNKEVPFIAETNQLMVVATGTEFNVSAYADDERIETTLVEGRVTVYGKEGRQVIRELTPYQSLKYNAETKKSVLESGNTEKYTAWKNGLLIFKNDPIEETARKLAKWYNVDVEITDHRIKGYTYTATFTDETLGQVLELMTLVSPVKFQLKPREKAQDGSFIKQKILIGLKDNG